MFHPDQYLAELTSRMQSTFGDRLIYVGLQGSYLRNEATEASDIDIMVIIRGMTVADMSAYRRMIAAMDGFDRSCGFICGLDELQHWNPLEICHLLHTTRDYRGTLASLVPAYTQADIRKFVQMSLGNLYHELCHRYIHASPERNYAALPGTYKGVFFILQNLHYLRSGHFLNAKQQLLCALSGIDHKVLETALKLTAVSAYDFDSAFSLIFSWCKETLIQLS